MEWNMPPIEGKLLPCASKRRSAAEHGLRRCTGIIPPGTFQVPGTRIEIRIHGHTAPASENDRSLKPKQKLLCFHAARISHERSVGPENPVAGNDDRERVRSVCTSDRLGGFRGRNPLPI